MMTCERLQLVNELTWYNTLNVKLSNSQLNKLKSGINNGTQVTLNFSSNVMIFIIIGDEETNFSRKLLLTNTQVSKIRKVFVNNSTVNIKFLKTRLSKVA